MNLPDNIAEGKTCNGAIGIRQNTFLQSVYKNCLPQWHGETRAEIARREKMSLARARLKIGVPRQSSLEKRPFQTR